MKRFQNKILDKENFELDQDQLSDNSLFDKTEHQSELLQKRVVRTDAPHTPVNKKPRFIAEEQTDISPRSFLENNSFVTKETNNFLSKKEFFQSPSPLKSSSMPFNSPYKSTFFEKQPVLIGIKEHEPVIKQQTVI